MIRVGLAIVLLAVFAAAFGPSLTPYEPSAQTLKPIKSLGIDELSLKKTRLANSTGDIATPD